MTTDIKTAMVLAAGMGTRMRPLTNNKPKSLIRVDNVPLIDYALKRFEAAGMRKAIVNVHYLADQLEAHLAGFDGFEIVISDEREVLLETGGGLIKAKLAFDDSPIFCTNTDAILMDEGDGEACTTLTEFWDGERMDALLLLSDVENATGYEGQGDFVLEESGRLCWPSEKPADSLKIFTGLQIIHPRLFSNEEERPVSTTHFWNKAMAQGRLYGITHHGLWMHVGDPRGLKTAENILRKGA